MVLVLVLPLAARAEDATTGSRVRVREELRLKLGEFKTKLRQLRDTRKQAVVERLNNRICTMNKNRVETMNNHLERMLAVTNRVAEKAAGLKTEGKDVGTVEAAVIKAKEAITEAKSAVGTQAGKECVIAITGSDTTVGAEVHNAISKLEAEIKAVREEVNVARQAATGAVKALALVMGEKV
jgi:prefoldin subunit 5